MPEGWTVQLTSGTKWVCNESSWILQPATHSIRDTVKSGMQVNQTELAHSRCCSRLAPCMTLDGCFQKHGEQKETKGIGAQGEAGFGSIALWWQREQGTTPTPQDNERERRGIFLLRLPTGAEDGPESQTLTEQKIIQTNAEKLIQSGP